MSGLSVLPDGPDRADHPGSAGIQPYLGGQPCFLANFLVNRRMNKSQQMRWSRDGADLLLQVRCAVYNGTLGAGFGHRFDRIAKADPAFAQAA